MHASNEAREAAFLLLFADVGSAGMPPLKIAANSGLGEAILADAS